MIPFDKQILDGKFNMGNITVDGISSKNKLKILPINTTINGVSCISNEDGSITLNGTANANCSLVISRQKISDEADYIFGVTSDFSNVGHNFEVGGYIYNADGNYKENISTATEYKHISNGEYITNFFIYFSSGATFDNFKIYPQLEKGKKRTSHSRYFDVYSRISNILEQFSGDLNTIKTTGFTYATGIASNIPVAGYSFYITTIALNEYYTYQEARRVDENTNNFNTYERQCYGGNWTDWKQTNTNVLKSDDIVYFTPTNVSNHAGYGNCYYYKLGSKVHIHIGVKVDTTENVAIYTLPNGYVPITNFAAVGLGDSLSNYSSVQINELGSISINSKSGYALIDTEYDTL